MERECENGVRRRVSRKKGEDIHVARKEKEIRVWNGEGRGEREKSVAKGERSEIESSS